MTLGYEEFKEYIEELRDFLDKWHSMEQKPRAVCLGDGSADIDGMHFTYSSDRCSCWNDE